MTGVSTLGQALTQIGLIKDQQTLFTSLSNQLSTGKKTQQFSGLGTSALVSQRSRANFTALETYTNNINLGNTRIELTLRAVEEFKAQAEILYSALIGLSQESVHQQGDPVTVDDPLTPEIEEIIIGYTSEEPDNDLFIVQDIASDLFDFLGGLLNSQDGDRYLLGGAETTTAPYSDSGTLDAAISSMLTDWKTGAITNSDLIGNLQERSISATAPSAITDSIIGYNAALAAGNAGDVSVRVSDSSEIGYTTLANEDPFRDIMVAVAYLKSDNLGPIADVYTPPNAPPAPPDIDGAPGLTADEMKDNFYTVYNSLIGMVSDAINSIDQVRADLQTAQARIITIKEGLIQDQNVLQDTIGKVEDVDLNEVAVKVNTLQIQLEASFSVTAKLQELTLTRYI